MSETDDLIESAIDEWRQIERRLTNAIGEVRSIVSFFEAEDRLDVFRRITEGYDFPAAGPRDDLIDKLKWSPVSRNCQVTMKPNIPDNLPSDPAAAYRMGWRDRGKASGRKAGRATSEAKSAAARANGAKGGRPRKPH